MIDCFMVDGEINRDVKQTRDMASIYDSPESKDPWIDID